MNLLASEYSSGCESGWTLYLDHSLVSPSAHTVHENAPFSRRDTENEEEEEDLSMVSDASSGPPHVNEDEIYNGFSYPSSMDAVFPRKSFKRQRIKEEHRSQVDPSCLDDTASSPLFNFSNKKKSNPNNNQGLMESVIDFSHGFSATDYEKNFGFLQASISGNQLSKTSGLRRIV